MVTDAFELVTSVAAELSGCPSTALAVGEDLSKVLCASEALRAACLPMRLPSVRISASVAIERPQYHVRSLVALSPVGLAKPTKCILSITPSCAAHAHAWHSHVRVGHTGQQHVCMQGEPCAESLMRVLLTAPRLQEAVAAFLLEQLVADADDAAAQRGGLDDDTEGSLQMLILQQLEALDVSSCPEPLLATMMDAFSVAPPQVRAALAKLLGEMVPADKTAGAPRCFPAAHAPAPPSHLHKSPMSMPAPGASEKMMQMCCATCMRPWTRTRAWRFRCARRLTGCR